jgi:DEAD/DEAH box helicase domain-containing protein
MSKPIDAVATLLETRFEAQIQARVKLPPESGDFATFPAGLDARLADVLRGRGIDKLYSHQAEAFEQVTAGRDTLLVSRTASGKTLAFLLPMLSAYRTAPAPFSVLMLYPTKALSRDQEGTLGALMGAAMDSRKLGTFDGDTPREERQKLQASADFVITNPDMLHAGILPNHNRNWKGFLSRLRYIVVDEVHAYRGAFGSHVSNVFRRLLRVCEIHGSRPQFICCSATVGNPAEHVRALFHREFVVVTKDGAPRPPRDLYFVNPPLKQDAGGAMYRQGTGSVTIPLLREAVKRGVRTICFCRARQAVERLHRAVTDGLSPADRERVKPYRGGLLPSERRALERGLATGQITAIISTNALELGIDIGDLDLCLLSGHPGTIASLWQQAGRVGRSGQRSVVVFVAGDAPIDQYLVHHSDYVTGAPVEQAWLNADNPYILMQHLPCAAHEHPLRPSEPMFDSPAYPLAIPILEQDKTLVPYHDCLRYARSDYPARGVNLRGMTDYNVDIYCGTEVIGEIDPIGARGELYKDAIYQHLGERYMSMELDLEKKLCRVERIAVDYFTEAVWENRIEMTEREADRPLADAALVFGAVHVNKQPKLYKKIRERSYENIGYGPITLPAFEYDTMGLSLSPPKAWRLACEAADPRYVSAAFFGLRYLLGQIAPSVCMADREDIETDLSLYEEQTETWRNALYVYDAHQGGVGYAEKIYERIEPTLRLCLHVLDECECECGCPSCVPPLPPGVENPDLEAFLIESNAAMACTRSLLTALLEEGRVALPEIREIRRRQEQAVTAPPPDVEALRLSQRLNRAARNLDAARRREH